MRRSRPWSTLGKIPECGSSRHRSEAHIRYNSPLDYELGAHRQSESQEPYAWQLEQALQRYHYQRSQAELAWIWAKLTRKPWKLPSLAERVAVGNVVAKHDLGMQTIPLRQISGSEGRSADFDRLFRPTQNHTRARWQSIAVAMALGMTLPPINVIKVGEQYFVRDGHHRVSVARALGQAEIDAQVTVWELASELPAPACVAAQLPA